MCLCLEHIRQSPTWCHATSPLPPNKSQACTIRGNKRRRKASRVFLSITPLDRLAQAGFLHQQQDEKRPYKIQYRSEFTGNMSSTWSPTVAALVGFSTLLLALCAHTAAQTTSRKLDSAAEVVFYPFMSGYCFSHEQKKILPILAILLGPVIWSATNTCVSRRCCSKLVCLACAVTKGSSMLAKVIAGMQRTNTPIGDKNGPERSTIAKPSATQIPPALCCPTTNTPSGRVTLPAPDSKDKVTCRMALRIRKAPATVMM